MTDQFDWDQFSQTSLVDWLVQHGEYYLAGFLETPAAPLLIRMGKGIRQHLERCTLPDWNGEVLYPSGGYSIWNQGGALWFSYPFPFSFQPDVWKVKIGLCKGEPMHEQLVKLGESLQSYSDLQQVLPPEFRLGGCGFTHSIPDFDLVVQAGLAKIADDVVRGLEKAELEEDSDRGTFYLALQDVLAGIRVVLERLATRLTAAIPGEARDRLEEALGQVPWLPARSFYEGLLALNMVFYLDGCDSLGRFDQVLGDLYQSDLNAGQITEEEGEALVRRFWQNVNQNNGWNCALGGSTGQGAPAYDRLTITSLKAARGMRRPNLALRIRPDMPAEVWDAALDTLASGCGLPALYNENAYVEAITRMKLVEGPDVYDFAFGGCTELMIHGKSCVGSLDGGINLLKILTDSLTHLLPTADSFDEVLSGFKLDVTLAIRQMTLGINQLQRLKAERQPQLMRSLLIRDCVENGKEYHAGGARYNWSVVNIGGLSNVVDSLAAVHEVVFVNGDVNGAELQDALAANFEGYELLRKQLSRCPRFGNDDPRADDLAEEISAFVFREFAKYTPWRGGRFLPACLMFVTYADAGLDVGASPDGRLAFAPIADSAGPVAGRDHSGPTAMMRSVSHLDWQNAPGTLVVNLRLNPEMFRGEENRARTRSLLKSYFELGNMQLQINILDQEMLEAAIRDPESYRDLVVRIGGYSEYFIALSPELRQTVLQRTVHGVNP